MIIGEVGPGLEATIELNLRSPGSHLLSLRAAIDTGFSDYITLPPRVVAQLKLPYVETIEMLVADNSIVQMPLYEVDVIWDGHPRTVYAQESESGPLVGMRLIEGFSLYTEVVDGGEVSVKQLMP